MSQQAGKNLQASGFLQTGAQHWNLSEPALYEEAVRRAEGVLTADGTFACRTGTHTGRSAHDKFFVKEPSSEQHIHWGATNRPLDQAHFDTLHQDMAAFARTRELFVLDAWAGADHDYRMPVRVVTEFAWHNLFARNMFIPENDQAARDAHVPEFTVVDLPSFKADPARHGTRSETFIIVDMGKRLVLIGGTHYAGEIKKSVFTILNYKLPLSGVLSMHCSANIGAKGDTALFFGLSGTGKTTLSSDPARKLIGDDEHGWSDSGTFNFEGGCYAKVIKLSREAEPQIYAASRRFGTILENVIVDPVTRAINFDDGALTENTRSSYPLRFIDNVVESGKGGHPVNIVMLCADAYGVLPPIARLSPDAAAYHFLSGYTARVAGTEKGVTEPRATFSSCFGAPFLPLAPGVYAAMLTEKIARHNARVWLVNTGWTGGPYGVGSRMKIAYTRVMVNAALNGDLDKVEYRRHPQLNVDFPMSCPGVSASVLDPQSTWPDPKAYDEQVSRLAGMFVDNFKTFEAGVTAAIKDAGPRA